MGVLTPRGYSQLIPNLAESRSHSLWGHLDCIGVAESTWAYLRQVNFLKFPNAIVLNAVFRRNTNERKRAQAQVCKRASNGCKRVQKSSGRPRTTLGFSPPLDARQPLTGGIPQSRNSRAEGSLGQGLLALSLQGWPFSPQGVLRNLSTEEFLGSGVPGHPRVVSIQGWFLASPKSASTSKIANSQV